MHPVRAFRWILLATVPAWAGSADAVESVRVEHDGIGYRQVTIDLAHERLDLVWRDADGKDYASIDRLRDAAKARGQVLTFATNAGIYDRQQRPLGLHVEDGRTIRAIDLTNRPAGSGNFSMPPNGIFYVDRLGRAGVMRSVDWPKAGIAARIATQSAPMLVVDGAVNPRFEQNSSSRKWRSGVCARATGEVVFAVSEIAVNFHEFARFFADAVGCRAALYLDGSLSRVYVEGEGYAGAPAILVKPYAGIFAVFTPSVGAATGPVSAPTRRIPGREP